MPASINATSPTRGRGFFYLFNGVKHMPDTSIADAINNLASEMRLLTFGGASPSESSHGAIEDLTLTVHSTGREIASALSEIATAINNLANAVAESSNNG